MPYEFGGPRRRGSVPWDRVLTFLPLVVLGLVVLVLALGSFYTVAQHEKAVVLRFGKYLKTVEPGLQFRVPWVDRVLKVSVEERSLRLPFAAGAERPGHAREDETLMLTGDLNAASVEWTIQWKVAQPDDFLFRFYQAGDERYPEQMITTISQTVMNRLVGDYSIDEVLTEKRGEIGEEARRAMQQILDGYACGVAIRDLQMQRISPPEKVRPSFDQVNASIQQRDQLQNEANKERNKLRPKALAEKDKMIREAEGFADRRRAESRGEIEALLAKYRAFQRAPEITRQRLYLEAMQEVLRQVESKVILDAELQSHVLPLLPLEQGARKP